jgi:hypothetical protein
VIPTCTASGGAINYGNTDRVVNAIIKRGWNPF